MATSSSRAQKTALPKNQKEDVERNGAGELSTTRLHADGAFADMQESLLESQMDNMELTKALAAQAQVLADQKEASDKALAAQAQVLTDHKEALDKALVAQAQVIADQKKASNKALVEQTSALEKALSKQKTASEKALSAQAAK